MVINIIVSVVMIAIGIILLLDVISQMGVRIPYLEIIKNRFLRNIIIFKDKYKSHTPSRLEMFRVMLECAMARIVVYFLSVIIIVLNSNLRTMPTLRMVISEWRKWDAVNYIRIALLGYDGYEEKGNYTTLVFFPMYAWIMKFVNSLVKNIELSALIVSSVAFVIGCCYLYVLIAKEYGKKIAENIIIYISIFPFAFFFGSMMPESVFFMFLAMGLYYIREHKWFLVSLIGVLASLTRMQGILLIIPMILEWIDYRKPVMLVKRGRKRKLIRCIFTELIFAPVMFLGFGIYLMINYNVTGDCFKFLEYQDKIWNQRPQWFGQTVADIARRAFTTRETNITRVAVWLPDLVIFILAAVLIVYGIGRIHNKYNVFLYFYLIMNYLPTWLMSGGRYMSVAIPMFLSLAVFTENHKWTQKWVVYIQLILFGIYLYGFLAWKQIM